MMNFAAREKKLLEAMARARVDALLVTHLPNVRYLCGFTGSAAVLIVTPARSVLLTDGRYAQQAREEVKDARVAISKGPALKVAANWLQKAKLQTIGIEAEHMTISLHSALLRDMGKGIRVREMRGLVEQLRMVKDRAEVECIRRAVVLGDGLLEDGLNALKPGVAETHVAAAIEFAARKRGADGMSFDTIVAAGPRSALPHGRATQAAIPRKGFVVMDFGVILAGYCSDMTRTVHVGRASSQARQLYDTVREAQEAGIDAVRSGVSAGAVDNAARKVLIRAGYGRYFTHSTGHGVGLEIHEPPRVGRGSSDPLEAGMVITIEPGAYIPGEGGVRIEDIVVVTENGCEILTSTPKELITL